MIKKTMMILLLVAVAGCQVTLLEPDDPEDLAKTEAKAEAEKKEIDVLERIRVMKIVQEETLLMRDIFLLKAEIAKIQAAGDSPNPPQRPDRQPVPFKRPPMPNEVPAREKVEIPELGVEGEFVPLDELPENMK